LVAKRHSLPSQEFLDNAVFAGGDVGYEYLALLFFFE